MSKARALPGWAKYGWKVSDGEPRYDEHGAPLYKPWELLADATVHALGVLWVIGSSVALLIESRDLRYWVYVATLVLSFSSSAAYNIIGCGVREATEQLRRLDQASIFVTLAGQMTVFLFNTPLLIGLWVLCGTGALLKVVYGHDEPVETLALVAYACTGALPLGLVRPGCPGYPTVVAVVGTIAVGVRFGYMSWRRGATAFWHVCVLAASVAYWTLVYRAAKEGAQHVIQLRV